MLREWTSCPTYRTNLQQCLTATICQRFIKSIVQLVRTSKTSHMLPWLTQVALHGFVILLYFLFTAWTRERHCPQSFSHGVSSEARSNLGRTSKSCKGTIPVTALHLLRVVTMTFEWFLTIYLTQNITESNKASSVLVATLLSLS